MSEQSLPRVDGTTETEKSLSKTDWWRVNLWIHKWGGLVAMAWLTVLGVTGLILDHPEWRWTQQWTMSSAFGSDHVLNDETLGTIVRKFHIKESDPNKLIGGGVRGLWRTTDSGQTWTEIPYAGADGLPMMLTLLPSRDDDWGRIWLGTDDGIWMVSGEAGEATPVALGGYTIADLDYGRPGELVGIADHSKLFRVTLARPDQIDWITPRSSSIPGLPQDVSLAKLMVDMHFGKGLTGGSFAMWINDYGGIVFVVLSLTGFFYWLFPKLWQNPERKAKWDKQTRRSTLQWLFRFHGPVLGLLAIIPIIYLSVTGIYLDHARAWIPPTMAMMNDRAVWQGPYDDESLIEEMEGLRTDPADSNYLSVLTRVGLIISNDGGKSWAYDEATPFAVNARHHNPGHVHRAGYSFMGNHGGPSYVRSDATGDWHLIEGMRLMAQDAAPLGEDWVLKGSRGFFRWNEASNELQKLDIPNPPLEGMPVKRFMLDLHTGMMIHSSFVWVNDFVSVLAIFMCFTGFLAWWRKKWI